MCVKEEEEEESEQREDRRAAAQLHGWVFKDLTVNKDFLVIFITHLSHKFQRKRFSKSREMANVPGGTGTLEREPVS